MACFLTASSWFWTVRILPPSQSGFSVHNSTEAVLLSLVSDICPAVGRSQLTVFSTMFRPPLRSPVALEATLFFGFSLVLMFVPVLKWLSVRKQNSLGLGKLGVHQFERILFAHLFDTQGSRLNWPFWTFRLRCMHACRERARGRPFRL